jgi:LysM repeat protein
MKLKLPALITKDKLQAVTRRMSQRVAQEYAGEPSIKLSSAFIVVLVLHVVAVGGIYAFNSIKAHKLAAIGEGPMEAVQGAAESAPETAVPAATSTPAASRTPARAHRVRAGDTLEKVAALHGVTASELQAANDLKGATNLRPGQELHIPQKTVSKSPGDGKTVVDGKTSAPLAKEKAKDTPATAAKATPANVAKETPASAKAPTGESGVVYTVVKGDTPASIARKLGVRSSDLLKLNKIEDPRKLQIGQKLQVPAKTKS